MKIFIENTVINTDGLYDCNIKIGNIYKLHDVVIGSTIDNINLICVLDDGELVLREITQIQFMENSICFHTQDVLGGVFTYYIFHCINNKFEYFQL